MDIDGDHQSAFVAGSGIGAATVSLMLADLGWHVTHVKEAATPVRPSDDVVIIDPASAAALRKVGVAVEPGGRRRSGVLDALHDLEQRTSAVEVLFSEVLQADRNGDVWFAHGDDVHHRHVELVVAADGAGSPIREGGDFGARRRRTGRFFLRAFVNDVAVTAGHDQATSLGRIGWHPVDGGDAWFYADVTSNESSAAVLAGDAGALLRIWRSAAPQAAAVLDGFDDRTDVSLVEAMEVGVRRRHDGRVALLGSAAHTNGAAPGRAASSAIGDAAALATALAHHDDVATALHAYDRARRSFHRAARGWLPHRATLVGSAHSAG